MSRFDSMFSITGTRSSTACVCKTLSPTFCGLQFFCSSVFFYLVSYSSSSYRHSTDCDGGVGEWGTFLLPPLSKEGSVKENANACDRELMCDVACVRACVCVFVDGRVVGRWHGKAKKKVNVTYPSVVDAAVSCLSSTCSVCALSIGGARWLKSRALVPRAFEAVCVCA